MDQARWLWRTLPHSGLLTLDFLCPHSYLSYFFLTLISLHEIDRPNRSKTVLLFFLSFLKALSFISTPLYRAIPNLVYFYPSDAVSACRAVELAANYKNMTFIRTSRPATPVIYANDETFEIGKAKVCEHVDLVKLQ